MLSRSLSYAKIVQGERSTKRKPKSFQFVLPSRLFYVKTAQSTNLDKPAPQLGRQIAVFKLSAVSYSKIRGGSAMQNESFRTFILHCARLAVSLQTKS